MRRYLAFLLFVVLVAPVASAQSVDFGSMGEEPPFWLLRLLNDDDSRFAEDKLFLELKDQRDMDVSLTSCSGFGCDHTNPSTTGCSSGAYTVDVKIIPNQTQWVELRYSPSCGTNWTRSGSTYSRMHYLRLHRYTDHREINESYYGTGAYTNQLYCTNGCTARSGVSSGDYSGYYYTGAY